MPSDFLRTLHMYTGTQIYTCVHICTQECKSTCMYTYVHRNANLHGCTHMHTGAQIYMCVYICTQECKCTCVYTYAHRDTNLHMCTYMHTTEDLKIYYARIFNSEQYTEEPTFRRTILRLNRLSVTTNNPKPLVRRMPQAPYRQFTKWLRKGYYVIMGLKCEIQLLGKWNGHLTTQNTVSNSSNSRKVKN